MDKTTLKRLLLVKRLYAHGVAHSEKNTEIDRFLAIHHFDNSIELFLKILATIEGIATSSRQDPKFKDLWDEINKKINGKNPAYSLPLREQIFALHDNRNLAQHQGDAPSYETIVKYSSYTKDFLVQCIRDLFSIDFENLHAADMIVDSNIRSALIDSETNLDRGLYKESIISTAKAFAYLKIRKARDLSSERLKRFTTFGLINSHKTIRINSAHSFDAFERKICEHVNKALEDYNKELSSELKERAEKINEFAEAVEEELAILKMGVDYNAFKRFGKISPYAFFSLGSSEPNISAPEPTACTKENALFCYEFVIDAALSLQ